MRFRRTFIALTLAASILPTQAQARDLCPQWAQEMHATRDDMRMHAMGCHAPYGVYVRGRTHCDRVAYHVSEHEFNFAKIGRRGCVLNEDWSWSDE